jgi:hypothetical protein
VGRRTVPVRKGTRARGDTPAAASATGAAYGGCRWSPSSARSNTSRPPHRCSKYYNSSAPRGTRCKQIERLAVATVCTPDENALDRLAMDTAEVKLRGVFGAGVSGRPVSWRWARSGDVSSAGDTSHPDGDGGRGQQLAPLSWRTTRPGAGTGSTELSRPEHCCSLAAIVQMSTSSRPRRPGRSSRARSSTSAGAGAG